MEKEELLNKIAAAFGANDKEIKIAYDAFLQKISEEVEPDEALRIPMFGIFQIKKKSNNETGFSGNKDINTSYRLLFFPEDTNEVVELDFIYSSRSKKNSPESAFSLSIGKPIIPILETQKKELLIQSAYLNLLHNYREKADELFESSVKLEGFNVDNTIKELSSGIDEQESKSTHEVKVENNPENMVENKNESIPWNFGSEIVEEVPEQEHQGEQAEDNNSFEIVDDFELSDDDLKNVNFDPFSIHPEESGLNDYRQVDDIINLPDSSEFDSEKISSEEKSEIDKLIDNTAFDINDLDAEENKDYENIIKADSDINQVSEMEPEAVMENDEPGKDDILSEEENPAEDEVVSIDVNKAREFSSQKNIPLEEVGETEVNVRYSKWFWIVLLALLTITAGGIYYFLFSKRTAMENTKNIISQQTKKIEPEVIDRNYQVPVSIIPKNNGETGKTQGGISEPKNENQNKADNHLNEKTINAKPATPQNIASKENKEKNVANETTKKIKQPDESANKTKLQEKQKETDLADSGIERKDNKNTLIREYIFTDGKKYTIQLSSWKSKDIAIKEVKRLRKLGLDAYLTQSYVPSVGGTWFRVRVGEYPTVKNAEEVLEKIK